MFIILREEEVTISIIKVTSDPPIFLKILVLKIKEVLIGNQINLYDTLVKSSRETFSFWEP